MKSILPHSADAESGVLGSFAVNARDVGALISSRRIQRAHFHLPNHGIIFDAMMEMWANAKPIDLITLTQHLRDRKTLDSAGGPAAIADLLNFPTAANVSHWLEIVEALYVRREIIRVALLYSEKAFQEDDAESLLSGMADDLAKIATGHSRTDDWTLKTALHEKVARMESDTPDTALIKTGIAGLDRHSRVRKGDMPAITGERKGGKSILSLTIAANIAKGGQPVLYFSLEDKRPKVIDRLVAAAARVPIIRHHEKTLTEGEMQAVIRAIQWLSEAKFTLRDDVLDLAGIQAVSRQMKTRHPDLSAIFVDYAQLVRVPHRKGGNRQEEVAAVSRGLRLLAMELDTPLFLLMQLNKDGEARESMALEQDATACWKIVASENDEDSKTKLIVIPWQRDGEGDVAFPVRFNGEIAKIDNAGTE